MELERWESGDDLGRDRGRGSRNKKYFIKFFSVKNIASTAYKNKLKWTLCNVVNNNILILTCQL